MLRTEKTHQLSDGPLTQKRFEPVQQSPEGRKQNPDPVLLLHLVLRLLQGRPELGNHTGRQTHLQRLQQPAAQQPAQTLIVQQGQRVWEALLWHRATRRHLNATKTQRYTNTGCTRAGAGWQGFFTASFSLDFLDWPMTLVQRSKTTRLEETSLCLSLCFWFNSTNPCGCFASFWPDLHLAPSLRALLLSLCTCFINLCSFYISYSWICVALWSFSNCESSFFHTLVSPLFCNL